MKFKRGWFKRAWKKYKGSHKSSFARNERIVRQRIRNQYPKSIRRAIYKNWR